MKSLVYNDLIIKWIQSWVINEFDLKIVYKPEQDRGSTSETGANNSELQNPGRNVVGKNVRNIPITKTPLLC